MRLRRLPSLLGLPGSSLKDRKNYGRDADEWENVAIKWSFEKSLGRGRDDKLRLYRAVGLCLNPQVDWEEVAVDLQATS